MSPADLKEPFNPSCCDGPISAEGGCGLEDMSTQPCGCDKGLLVNGVRVPYLCAWHRAEAEAEDKWKNEYTDGR